MKHFVGREPSGGFATQGISWVSLCSSLSSVETGVRLAAVNPLICYEQSRLQERSFSLDSSLIPPLTWLFGSNPFRTSWAKHSFFNTVTGVCR
jgi:hypothetical protein